MDLHIKITKWPGIVLSYTDHSTIHGFLLSKKVATENFQFGLAIGGNGSALKRKYYLQMS